MEAVIGQPRASGRGLAMCRATKISTARWRKRQWPGLCSSSPGAQGWKAPARPHAHLRRASVGPTRSETAGESDAGCVSMGESTAAPQRRLSEGGGESWSEKDHYLRPTGQVCRSGGVRLQWRVAAASHSCTHSGSPCDPSREYEESTALSQRRGPCRRQFACDHLQRRGCHSYHRTNIEQPPAVSPPNDYAHYLWCAARGTRA